MLQYKSRLLILYFWYNFSLFIRVQPSFSGFSFLFSPSRSTMTAEGVFLLVLIVMVLPCSSLEGKCHETQLVTSDLKQRLLLLRGEVPVCIDRQILANFSCLDSLAVAKDYSRSYTITRGSWAQTLVVKMCNGCLCSPSHCDSCSHTIFQPLCLFLSPLKSLTCTDQKFTQFFFFSFPRPSSVCLPLICCLSLLF